MGFGTLRFQGFGVLPLGVLRVQFFGPSNLGSRQGFPALALSCSSCRFHFFFWVLGFQGFRAFIVTYGVWNFKVAGFLGFGSWSFGAFRVQVFGF